MRKRHVRYSAYRYKTKYTRAKQVAKLLFMESKLRIEELQSEIEDMQSDIELYKPYYDEHFRMMVNKELALVWWYWRGCLWNFSKVGLKIFLSVILYSWGHIHRLSLASVTADWEGYWNIPLQTNTSLMKQLFHFFFVWFVINRPQWASPLTRLKRSTMTPER